MSEKIVRMRPTRVQLISPRMNDETTWAQPVVRRSGVWSPSSSYADHKSDRGYNSSRPSSCESGIQIDHLWDVINTETRLNCESMRSLSRSELIRSARAQSRVDTSGVASARSKSALSYRFTPVMPGSAEGKQRNLHRLCRRAESVMNEESRRVHSDLSRECCDVLGPAVCHDCMKVAHQVRSQHHTVSKFPDIDESAKSLFVVPLIKRIFPDMTTAEIKSKLQSGEIAEVALKQGMSVAVQTFDQRMTDVPKYTKHHKRRRLDTYPTTKTSELTTAAAENRAQSAQHRSQTRRMALFTRSPNSTPSASGSDVGFEYHSPTPRTSISPTQGSDDDDDDETHSHVHMARRIACRPPILSLRWGNDFPRFHCGIVTQYKMPLWKIEESGII